MNRFENIDICEFETNGVGEGSFNVIDNGAAIDWIETVRKAKGYTDMISLENDIYYTFMLIFDVFKKEVRLVGTANNTEEDDWVNYECELRPEEKEYLMWLIIKHLTLEECV